MEWHRVPRDATDIFDRPVESYGNCSNADALPFAIALLILNISILIMANWWAYQSRNIETEYHESRYIGITMASILQAWCMGIPILIVVWENPQAKFFVESGRAGRVRTLVSRRQRRQFFSICGMPRGPPAGCCLTRLETTKESHGSREDFRQRSRLVDGPYRRRLYSTAPRCRLLSPIERGQRSVV